MFRPLLLLLLAAGCKPEPTPPVDTPPVVEDETACDEAEAALGYRACVPRIPDEDTFNGVTIPSASVDQLRVGKYLVPARDDARVPPVFLDVNAFTLHYDFLRTAFPDSYTALTTEEYQDLVLHPDTREFYAGTYSLYLEEDGFYYGFTVWDDPGDATSTVTLEQVTAAWETLQDRFEIGPLAWVPNSPAQQEAAIDWDAPFDIHNPAVIDYEAYNPGEAYGYLRLYTLAELADATEAASFGYQDFVVIDEAPEDLERVVSGIVTGTRQGGLSHLNVRSAARGTPNCYIREPLAELAAWQDHLVHFTCGDEGFEVADATTEDAEAWWTSIRPEPVTICVPNLDERAMPGLLDLPTDTADRRDANVCAYGAKGANLATLYQRIDDEYQLDGFVIPFAYYDDFMRAGTWTVDLGSGAGVYTFAETIAAWHADATFLTDATVRRDRLEALRAAMDEVPVDPALLAELETRILAVFGNDTTMVRFRSSSNAEDGLDFSGAGLYNSDSACLADELDADEVGPSHCDPDKADEETLTDSLQEVWASSWNLAAWEERDWYGIDHERVAMGILCDTRSNAELANIVAFAGNPTADGDDRYLVNAQLGELEVVSAESGVYPEKALLTLEDGVVTQVDRVSSSSEADLVLTDAELAEIGAVLWDIALLYPNDDEVPEGHTLIWDTEWKITSEGQLIIKQIRPFLR
ncbi:MAG: PEP/pyruvate-binding domain-containing protein [Pseudomonadota bacterium]|nr:PEP/pyruvate-binding domain-containing protein [Pseudomonadota bacterium]